MMGHLLMWFARHEVRASGKVWTTPFFLTCVYMLVCFVPVGGWFVFADTAWATVYLRPESYFTMPVRLMILSFYFFGGFFGALLGQSLMQLKRPREFWISQIVSVVVLAIVGVLTIHEYQLSGTYEEYWAGRALPFEQTPLYGRINIAGFLWYVPYGALLFYFWKRGKRFQS